MLLSQRPHAVFKAAVHSGPSSGLPSCIPHRPSRGAGRRQRYLCSLSFYNAPGAHIPAASYAVHSLKQLRSTVVPRAQAGGVAGGGSTGGNSSSGGGGGGGSSGGSSGAAGRGDSAPHPMRIWTLVYAAFLAVGGVFAFVKAGSQKSLTSALGAALILTLSSRTMLVGSARGSLAVCAAISLFLSVIMAGRYSRTCKVMPAGMTAGASIAMSAAYIFSLVA